MRYRKGEIVTLGDLCPERLRAAPLGYNGLGKVDGYEGGRVKVFPCYGRAEWSKWQWMAHPVLVEESDLDELNKPDESEDENGREN